MMGFFEALKSALSSSKTEKQYAKMMNGYSPIFSQFGSDIYAADIVQIAIHRIATEIGKLKPCHIRTDSTTGIQQNINSDINKLLKYRPNPLMNVTDFLEKCVFMYMTHKNCYIYPAYDVEKTSNGYYRRRYKALYPLNPSQVDYLQDTTTGEYYIKFYFNGNADTYTMRYADIIHWRKDFSANDFVGGDASGESQSRGLLKLLQADRTAIEGIDNVLKSSLAVRGIIKINTMLDDELQKAERESFETKLKENKSGFITSDVKTEYQPITVDPKAIDNDTMSFITSRILAAFDMSWEIFNGKFTEAEYQAFYESCLESMIISLGREFTTKLFTPTELDFGNEIIFYQRSLMFTSTQNKIAAVDMLSRIGGLTDNQILAIFGYEPFDGGDVRHISLNYINRDIADSYQLGKLAGTKKVETEDGKK